MHPTLARYLNLDVAADTLHRDERGQVLKAEERPYAEVARAEPERRAAVLAARGQEHPGDAAQQALLYLAAHAAVAALREDEGLKGPLATAEQALRTEGADDEEVERFLAAVVLEEAFGYDEGAERFDRAFFAETLQAVPELAKLTRERVDALLESFTRSADDGWRRAHQVTARALIETAWEEGPEPINPEHLEAALEVAARRLGGESSKAPEAMRRAVEFLEKQRLLGPLRRGHLFDALARCQGGVSPPDTQLN